jgi:pimeloyl-ACP methyl ester carboxylesterase
MPYLTVAKENSGNIDLYYEDHGAGKPVILIHGWPLSGRAWEKQVSALVNAGHRVITYDRRGFGNSGKPTFGYDYNTLAKDLDTLITKLKLRDVTLVGFSMGGGEVARYVGKYGSARVKKAVFIAAIPPFLLKTADNPQGGDASIYEGIKKAIVADRPAFLTQFLENFYNADVLRGKLISEQVIQLSWNIASGASPTGTLVCVSSWLEDFRADLKRFDIPTLVIHGDDDRILPIDATGKRMPEFVKHAQLVVVKGGPHGLTWTHADAVNRPLLEFLAEDRPARKSARA